MAAIWLLHAPVEQQAQEHAAKELPDWTYDNITKCVIIQEYPVQAHFIAVHFSSRNDCSSWYCLASITDICIAASLQLTKQVKFKLQNSQWRPCDNSHQ